MLISINEEDPRPVYTQIAAEIKDQIRTGDLTPGDELPSVWELADSLDVDADAVDRAYEQLWEQQVVRVSVPFLRTQLHWRLIHLRLQRACSRPGAHFVPTGGVAHHAEHGGDERWAAIGRMAGAVAHDLRTPLAVIRTALPVLLRHDLPNREKQEFARIVNAAVDQMADMAQDVLEYARGESVALRLAAVDVNKFVASVAEALRPCFEASGMTLCTEVHGAMTIRADAGRLARAFHNIAGNAMDAMGHEGTFTISAAGWGKFVRFALTDDGPGLSPEVADRVFEPLVTRGKRRGSGLGLPIAREIVQAHGGEIQIESRTGEGTQFVIDLPAADVALEAPRAASSREF